MLKKVFPLLILLALLLLPSAILALPPAPATVTGVLTVDDVLISNENDTGYIFEITRLDGASFIPAATDMNGIGSDGQFLIEIPIYDPDEQAGAARTGDMVRIHVYKGAWELTVISPADGQFTVGETASLTQFAVKAHTNQRPLADAGLDQTVDEGDTVLLN